MTYEEQQQAKRDAEAAGHAWWVERGDIKSAPRVDAAAFGPHSYFANENRHQLGGCAYGCGCDMHQSSSKGPVDPFGPCPNNPKSVIDPIAGCSCESAPAAT